MIAESLDVASASGPMKVLDIAAGHGAFGIAIAQRNPNAQIVAVDWPNVLQVARENAAAAGLQDTASQPARRRIPCGLRTAATTSRC